jgi:cyclopropane-fatty-acyl-phospholipid synthase
VASRGDHLVRADRRFATGAGLLGRLAAPAVRADSSTSSTGGCWSAGSRRRCPAAAPLFARLVDQLDRRLAAAGRLPRPGPVAVVEIKSWMALVRLATSGSVGWYKAWAAGEWTSPDPVPLFELFTANALSLGDTARAKGPARWINAAAHRLRDNAPRQARDNIAAHYDLGNDFYAAWLDEGMTYSSARFPTPSFERSRRAGACLDFARHERG